MTNRVKWFSILMLGLVPMISSLVMSCASTLEESLEEGTVKPNLADTAEPYLVDIDAIFDEAFGLAYEDLRILENADRYTKSEIIAEYASNEKAYNELLLRLIKLECPHEYSELREYTMDAITYYKLTCTENWAWFVTDDFEHLDKSCSYLDKATKSHTLFNEEWDRLKGR